MTDITTLIARLEAAKGPDRELDAEIFAWSEGGRVHCVHHYKKEFFWERLIDGLWIRGLKPFSRTPKFTASIDAAVALAERVLVWRGFGLHITPLRRPHAYASSLDGRVYGSGDAETVATPAIALTIAILRAKQGEEKAMQQVAYHG